MNIHLIYSSASQLKPRLERVARSKAWQIHDHVFNADSTLPPIVRSTQTAVIVDVGEDLFAHYLECYLNQHSGQTSLGRAFIFSPHYHHQQAAQIAGIQTLSYALHPDNDADLADYLEHIRGQLNCAKQYVASVVHGEFAKVVDYSAIISMTDAQGRIIYANDNFCQISGYSREELLGQNHSLLKSGRHHKQKYHHLWQNLSNGKPWQGYFCNRNKNGEEYWVDSAIHPILDSEGEISSYISIRYDVTREVQLKAKLVKNDERFRTSHSFANVGAWEWHVENNTFYCSREIHKLLGYAKPELEPSLNNFLKAVHPDDRTLVKEQAQTCIDEGLEYNIEYRVVHPDGNVRWVSSRGHVIQDKHGNTTRMLGVLSDIHELKQAQETAQRAEQLKSSFISTLSHEIRNPLNALSGYNQLISQLSEQTELKSYSAKIDKIVEHISSILADINLNTKLESGAIEQQRINTNLKSICDESIALLGMPGRDIEIIVANIDGYVLAEPKYLRQVIVNLLSNACKYNKAQGRVTLRSRALSNQRIRLEVEDTGHGINPEQKASIFQPYERLSWQKSEIDGLGLGLTICQQLIHNMQGEIGVESELGKGSTFWIELDQADNLAEHCHDTNESTNNDTQGISLPSQQVLPKRVLVLDDNEFNREFMQAQLTHFGIQATFAHNGIEGIKALELALPELVVTDLNMPQMGGPQFIERLRGHRDTAIKKVPIIIMSADTEAGKRISDLYSIEFLEKPFTAQALIQSFANACHGKQLRSAPAQTDKRKHEVLDQGVMQHFIGDNKQARQHLLNIYLESLKSAREQIKANQNVENPKLLRSIAHKLASSSLSIGATRLTKHFKELEIKLRQAYDPAHIKELLNETLASADEVINWLQHQAQSTSPLQISHHPEYRSDKQSDIHILIIDDDEFAIAQISDKLNTTRYTSFKAVQDAQTALALLVDEYFDIVVLDIDMPNIDGTQFIRLFAAIYQEQAIVLYSGESRLINPVAELLSNYGMHYLGILNKPCSKLGIHQILKQFQISRDQQQAFSPSTEPYSDEVIKRCIDNNQIQVLYQPQIHVGSGRISSVEALSRLVSDQQKVIPPSAFLSRLEALQLETVFAHKVAYMAIKQLAQWRKDGHELKVAINFSMHALEDLDLPDHLKQCCEHHDVSPEHIIIEVTESALSAQPKLALEVQVRLKLLGFTLSIDDFGTGYASLEKLQKLPFTEMKLDRSYVASAAADDVSMAILNSSLVLAKQLNMTTVAEGIEHKENYELVVAAGAHYVQGYYFAKPMPAQQLIAWKKDFNHDNSKYF